MIRNNLSKLFYSTASSISTVLDRIRNRARYDACCIFKYESEKYRVFIVINMLFHPIFLFRFLPSLSTNSDVKLSLSRFFIAFIFLRYVRKYDDTLDRIWVLSKICDHVPSEFHSRNRPPFPSTCSTIHQVISVFSS